MKHQTPNTTEYDRLVAALVKSTALRHEELEQIAAREDLFLSVKRRIVAEAREEQRTLSEGALFTRPRVVVFASVVSVLTILFTVAAIVERSNATRRTSPSVAHTTAPTKYQEPRPEVINNDAPQATRPEPNYDQASARQNVERPAPIRTIYHPSRTAETAEPEPQQQPVEFYALGDMNSNESLAGGRVVRVDLPRASLVSLGVNVPLGNDKQLIKADLLIGPDGVPRAIRVIE